MEDVKKGYSTWATFFGLLLIMDTTDTHTFMQEIIYIICIPSYL